MTFDNPDKGIRLKLPTWSAEFIALMLVAMVTYGGTHFLDTALTNQRLEDRMAASEKDRAEIHQELEHLRQVQEENTMFRESAKIKFDDIVQNQEEIKTLLREHMRK
jgi:hypothetical protein